MITGRAICACVPDSMFGARPVPGGIHRWPLLRIGQGEFDRDVTLLKLAIEQLVIGQLRIANELLLRDSKVRTSIICFRSLCAFNRSAGLSPDGEGRIVDPANGHGVRLLN